MTPLTPQLLPAYLLGVLIVGAVLGLTWLISSPILTPELEEAEAVGE